MRRSSNPRIPGETQLTMPGIRALLHRYLGFARGFSLSPEPKRFTNAGDTQAAKGTVWYGMHFYPGVAEYRDSPKAEPYRVFLNENTIRNMGPSFAGCPVFVEHVDGVTADVDALRSDMDGLV